MSIKSTFAPAKIPQFELETNVLALVHNMSPGPNPRAKQDICRADVALLTA